MAYNTKLISTLVNFACSACVWVSAFPQNMHNRQSIPQDLEIGVEMHPIDLTQGILLQRTNFFFIKLNGSFSQ